MKAAKAMKAVKAMKAMKSTEAPKAMKVMKAMKAECAKIVDALAEMGAAQVKSAGKFVIPGLVMIKTRKKPATKAGKRLMFGKEVVVAAKPAKTVVKAFPVAALKKSI